MPYFKEVSFAQPQSAEEMENARRQELAKQLQAQSQAPLQGQNVPGGWYVAPSPVQGLAKLAQAYTGAKMGREAQESQAKILSEREGRQSADLSLLAKALQGRQAEPAGVSEDAAGNITQSDALSAQSPSQSLGQAIPMMSPQIQQAAIPMMLEQQKLAQSAQQHTDTLAQRDRALNAKGVGGAQEFAPSSLGKLISERAALPPGSPLIAAYDQAIRNASQSQERNPSFQFLPTSSGYAIGDRRAGTMTPATAGGQPMLPIAADPNVQGQVARAQKSGKEQATAQVQAAVNLPQTIATAEQGTNLIDQMIGKEGDATSKPHPGFQDYVGTTWKPGMRFIEGSNAANYEAMHKQLTGRAFLQAFETLKGGGQITEIEGRKATEAITRMSKSQSENEYVKAAREFQEVIRAGVARAKQKAGGLAPQSPGQSGWGIKAIP